MAVGNTKIVKSFAWKLLEKGSLQVVAFLVTLVLARILSPQEYGIVSLVLVFTSIAIVFVQGGFNTALIQIKGATQEDFSTILYLSLFVSILLYSLLFPILSRNQQLPSQRRARNRRNILNRREKPCKR